MRIKICRKPTAKHNRRHEKENNEVTRNQEGNCGRIKSLVTFCSLTHIKREMVAIWK
jgi:hypothetical protein